MAEEDSMCPFVAVVILTWNHRERTARCLDSVLDLDHPMDRLSVIVVDNGSTDDTLEFIRSKYPQVELLANGENLGYAAGNNLGIAYALEADPDFVFIANNDVVLARDALASLIDAAKENPSAGFLGPKIYQSDAPSVIQSAGTVVDAFGQSYQIGLGQRDCGQFDVQRRVDSLVGCAILISRAALDRIGLLDERFYLYFEDVEWCLRARAHGFRVLYVPSAAVWHRSSNVRDADLGYITYYMTRNTYLLLAKHGFGAIALVRALVQHLIWLVNWTLNPKWRHKREQRDAILKALVDALLGNYGRQEWRYGL